MLSERLYLRFLCMEVISYIDDFFFKKYGWIGMNSIVMFFIECYVCFVFKLW